MSLFPWARFPAGLSDKPVDEQLAWLFLLDRWHRGEGATEWQLRNHMNWGGGKTRRFFSAAVQWAKDNGGAGPGGTGENLGRIVGEPTKVQRQEKEANGRIVGGTGENLGRTRSENQPPPPTPEALKKEKEIKNSQIPPTPQNPPSPSEPAGEGLGGKENLDFLGRSDREALAKHGIKTVAGLKAAEARNPIRYSKGVGQARADRILAALAAHEGKPFISDSTDSIDDVLKAFLEKHHGPKQQQATA